MIKTSFNQQLYIKQYFTSIYGTATSFKKIDITDIIILNKNVLVYAVTNEKIELYCKLSKPIKLRGGVLTHYLRIDRESAYPCDLKELIYKSI